MADPLRPAPPPRRRPVRGVLVGAALMALGAAGSWATARWAADWIENRTADDVRVALAGGGHAWADVDIDGLAVRLSGNAPDAVSHFQAVTAAGTAVDPIRIRDAITVPPPAEAAPPEFRVEILRNDQGTSVIGLAPQAMDRPALTGRLRRATGGDQLTDLLELADYPAPPGWDAALQFALTAAEQAPRAKVSVTAGRVEVAAVTDGEAERARLDRTLRDAVPDGVTLVADISAPRPVITPFALRLSKSADGVRLDRCAADSAAARDRILAAARDAGVAGSPDCAVGLGAPSPQWADAAVAAIAALTQLPSGAVALADTSVALDVPATVAAPVFAAARDRLAGGLPGAFTLTATQEPAPQPVDEGPIRFAAQVVGDGIRLQGTVPDDRVRVALESLAHARFGQVDSRLTINPDTPAGWTVRVMGALEGMTGLRRASAAVTPDLIRLGGITGDRAAAETAARLLGSRLGAGAAYELSLTYDPRLDPALDLPTGEECVAALNETMQQSEIGFEPNRAVIAGDPAPALQALSATMQRCGDFRIEVGGHTDSQGSDGFNRELSESRATAVVQAMSAAGIATANLTVHGYGETRPVSTNDTDIGREANRRIEFRLLSPNPVDAVPQAATVVRGVTRAMAAAPAAPSGPAPLRRIEGVPPGLAGGPTVQAAPDDDAADQAAPTAETAPDAGSEDIADGEAPTSPVERTPDERAAEEGISLRPDTVTVQGTRLSTPVPPPLPGADTLRAVPAGDNRPPARPDR